MQTIKVHVTAGDGCDYQRAILPVRFCADELLKFNVRLELTNDILRGDRPDALVIHRILKDKSLLRLCSLRHTGTKIVWECDDACDMVPQWSPVQYTEHDLEMLEALQGIAHIKWASTENLRDHVNADHVLPNLVDPEVFEAGGQPRPMRGMVQVLWFGSATHSEDLKLIEEPIRKFIERNPGKAKFTFWGEAPPGLLKEHLGRGHVQQVAPEPLGTFYQRLIGMKPDIVLCPLADHPFNECKSALKVLEGISAGACVIASKCPAFSGVALDGETAAVCDTADDWLAALEAMVADGAGRAMIAQQGRQLVEAEHLWTSPAQKAWVGAFLGALGR